MGESTVTNVSVLLKNTWVPTYRARLRRLWKPGQIAIGAREFVCSVDLFVRSRVLREGVVRHTGAWADMWSSVALPMISERGARQKHGDNGSGTEANVPVKAPERAWAVLAPPR